MLDIGRCGGSRQHFVKRAALRRIFAVAALIAAHPAIGQTIVQPSIPIAVAQPGMNLGDTSFLDAGGSPGLTLEVLGSASYASHSNDAAGKRLAGRHGQATGVLNIHPLYTTSLTVLGAALGFDVLVPTAVVGVDLPGPSGRVTVGGQGDVAVGTYLQWQGLQLAGRPLDVRAALSATIPTGTYSRDRAVNLGNNAWQLTPYVSVTLQPTATWEMSFRATYDWVGRNTAPDTGPTVRVAQAGDQLGINIATSYALSPKIRLGISGFGYAQLSETRSDDAPIAGSRQRVFGIGPGILWSPNSTSVVLVNFYREFGAQNRPEGDSMRLRLLQAF